MFWSIQHFAFSLVTLAVVSAAHDDHSRPPWTKKVINPDARFEAAGAFDVDNDGALDIVSGDSWYKGPDFVGKFPVRDVVKVGTYYNCFSTLPFDVNGDGFMDFVTCSYFDKNVGWVQNPGKAGETWTYHNIDNPGPSETAVAVDLTGDGAPEVLPNTVNTIVFYELVGSGTSKTWKKHDLGTTGAGHGIGTGDVNGDGRIDLLTPHGWLENPGSGASTPDWKFHKAWDLGASGIQILAADVNGDGRSDIIFGQGHARGLEWLRHDLDASGQAVWTRLPIDMSLPQAHVLQWVDLDGDGTPELFTGKRVYAHEVEPGDTDPAILASYHFDQAAGAWHKHLIYQGEGAPNAPKDAAQRDAMKDFPKGTAGTGVESCAIDIDSDGDLDLITPGKSGLYLFINPARTR
jgi:hypothetical protein